jgi:hypothetical protein
MCSGRAFWSSGVQRGGGAGAGAAGGTRGAGRRSTCARLGRGAAAVGLGDLDGHRGPRLEGELELADGGDEGPGPPADETDGVDLDTHGLAGRGRRVGDRQQTVAQGGRHPVQAHGR